MNHVLRSLLLCCLLLLPSLPPLRAAETYTLHLPLVADTTDRRTLGATLGASTLDATLPLAQTAGSGWARYGDLRWSDVEPTPGERRWHTLSAFEREVRAYINAGMTPIVVVRSAPTWAQARPGTFCGPIKPEAYVAFGAFLSDLVRRYSAPPYNIRYWEIWNEPDADAALVGPDSGFGCWGTPAAPSFGGEAYGRMLATVAPAIRGANPAAQIVFGGLLLDCDPAAPPAGKTSTQCASARFLDGALKAGGPGAFDVIDYHAYSYWSETPAIDWDARNAAWKHRGGATLGKLAFIRETLARYGTNKPIMMGEAGLLCDRPAGGCTEAFLADQAAYAARLYGRAYAARLLNTIWYTFDGPGWYNSAPLDDQQRPRPAYETLAFLHKQLGNAVYQGSTVAGGLESYRFRAGTTSYELIWTTDGSTRTIEPEPQIAAVYDTLGRPVSVAGNTTTIGVTPVLIVTTEPAG